MYVVMAAGVGPEHKSVICNLVAGRASYNISDRIISVDRLPLDALSTAPGAKSMKRDNATCSSLTQRSSFTAESFSETDASRSRESRTMDSIARPTAFS